jgi:DNA-directed RNA polymerase subunit RPC12/RpoP
MEIKVNNDQDIACSRCGEPGAEQHCWAPHALFDDAEQWPTDYLCQRCQRRWHNTMNHDGGSRNG